jgi:hypothetical protein
MVGNETNSSVGLFVDVGIGEVDGIKVDHSPGVRRDGYCVAIIKLAGFPAEPSVGMPIVPGVGAIAGDPIVLVVGVIPGLEGSGLSGSTLLTNFFSGEDVGRYPREFHDSGEAVGAIPAARSRVSNLYEASSCLAKTGVDTSTFNSFSPM